MYLMGVDVGTRAAHAVVIDEAGRVVAGAIVPYEPFTSPAPGWAEQDPCHWWRAFCDATGKILARGIGAGEIKGLALSGHDGSVLLDHYGDLLRPAIIGGDRRAYEQARWLSEKIGNDRLIALTCNRPSVGFALPALIWLRENSPEIWRRVRYILSPKDYVRYRLTGEFATDVSDASRSLLFDVLSRRWSKTMMASTDIDEGSLPVVYESAQQTGEISADGASGSGLQERTPVIAGATELSAATIAMGVTMPGIVAVNIAPGAGFVTAVSERPAVDSRGRLRSSCHSVLERWQVTAEITETFSHRWFIDRSVARDKDRHDPIDRLCIEAENSSASTNSLLWWSDQSDETSARPGDVRAVLIGVTSNHTRADVAKAVLEGAAFGLRDHLSVITAINSRTEAIRIAGSGSQCTFWRQLLADVCQKTVWSIQPPEGPAFGAALLAGVGCGVWPSIDSACEDTVATVAVSSPDLARAALLDQRYAVYRLMDTPLKNLLASIEQEGGASE